MNRLSSFRMLMSTITNPTPQRPPPIKPIPSKQAFCAGRVVEIVVVRSVAGDHNQVGFASPELQPASIGVTTLHLKLRVSRQCVPDRSGIFAVLYTDGNVFD